MRAGGRVRRANLVKVGGVTAIIGAEWTLGDSHVRPTMRFTWSRIPLFPDEMAALTTLSRRSAFKSGSLVSSV